MSDYTDYSYLEDLFNSPQYTEGIGMPGDTFAKRASALKSFISLSGLPLPQLLAGGWTEDQAPVPVNQTAVLYGNNPMYRDAFAAIDQGTDPQSVMANLAKNADQYGFDPTDETTAGRIYSTLEDYAKGQFAASQAQAENPGNTFTLSNGKKYKGNPDVMGFASEYDLLGQPSEKDLLKKYGEWRLNNGLNSHKGGVDIAPGVEQVGLKTFKTDPSGLNKVQKFQAERAIAARLKSARGNMVRSDANASAMRNLMAIRALIGM